MKWNPKTFKRYTKSYCNETRLKLNNLFFKDLYAQGRSNAGVLFASIPNFADFYSEDVNEGMECIRLLNEIIGQLKKGVKSIDNPGGGNPIKEI